jgi:hypothetical protein
MRKDHDGHAEAEDRVEDWGASGSLRSRSAAAVLRERFEREAGYGLEDGVVGDEWDPESDRSPKRDAGTRSALKTSVSITIAPRDPGAVTTGRRRGRHCLPLG